MTFLCSFAFYSVKAATIGVDPVAGSTAFVSGFGGLTLGYEFEVTATNGITVDGLGFWDHQSDGFLFGQTFEVGLWDAATGTLLRNSIISSGSALKPSLHPNGDWRVNSVTPLLLAPGLYRVGALFPESGANQTVDFNATFQTASGVTVVRFLRQIGSATLAMPDIGMPTTGSVCFGPTFTISSGAGSTPSGPVVVPSDFAALAGTTGLNTLLRNSGSPRAYQMQFSPAALGGLPLGARITELRFRLSANNFVAFPTNTIAWSEYQVTLAQAANPIPRMSTNFAANMVNPVLVRDGPLSLNAGFFAMGSGPNPFCSFLVFDTPYVYQGGDLVLLFRHTGNDSANAAFLDAVNSTTQGYGTNFRAFSASTFSASSGLQASVTITEVILATSFSESIFRDADNEVIVGTGGSPGGAYHLVSSTDLTLQTSQWMTVTTNVFDASGGFRFTNAPDPNQPARFFRITVP